MHRQRNSHFSLPIYLIYSIVALPTLLARNAEKRGKRDTSSHILEQQQWFTDRSKGSFYTIWHATCSVIDQTWPELFFREERYIYIHYSTYLVIQIRENSNAWWIEINTKLDTVLENVLATWSLCSILDGRKSEGGVGTGALAQNKYFAVWWWW